MNLPSGGPRRLHPATFHRNGWGLALLLCGLLGAAEPAWAEDPFSGAAMAAPGLPSPTDPVSDMEFASLAPTVIESWAPYGADAFKAAEVCHDAASDIYSIAVVYTFYLGFFNMDFVYRIRVEGDSSSPHYGEFIDRQFVGISWRVDHIDCTSDGTGSTFIAFDRRFEDAVWYRLTDTSRHGPYPANAGCEVEHAAQPRIAFGGGDEARVMLVVKGMTYEGNPFGEVETCGACVTLFDAYTGLQHPHPRHFWDNESNHFDFDVEWNGSAFVAAVPYRRDAGVLGVRSLLTRSYNSNGETIEEHQLPSFSAEGASEAWSTYPEKARLVYTEHANNPDGELFLKTDAGSYWIDIYGALRPHAVEEEASLDFVACENHGPSPGLAHVFDTRAYLEPESPEMGSSFFFAPSTIERSFYGLDPAPGTEPTLLDFGYTTRACETGTTPGDEEILVVRGRSGSTNVYWSLETP